VTARRSIRPATLADVPAIARVASACDEPIETPGVPGSPYAEHLLSRGRVFVAEGEGVVVGFSAVLDVGPSTHVSDLYVHPGARDRGVGKALLGEALAGAASPTMFASGDPRAVPLAVRAGLRALWPDVYLEGRAAGLPVSTLLIEPASIEDAAAEETGLTGLDRLADHRYWGTRRGAVSFLVRDGGTTVGVGVAVNRRGRAGRWLSHLAIGRDADAAAVALAAVRATATGEPAGPPTPPDARPHQAGEPRTSVCVPGPHPALGPLLSAGFRVVDRETFLAVDPAIIDPERLLPDPNLL
jgi:GNAT superfamily N-acetyltransferase